MKKLLIFLDFAALFGNSTHASGIGGVARTRRSAAATKRSCMVGVVKCPQCKPVRCAGADFIDTMAASLPDRQRESAAIVNKDLRRTYNASTRKWLHREYVFLTFGYIWERATE